MREKVKETPHSRYSDEVDRDAEHLLILFNDDVNPYDYVVNTLIEVCNHDPIQAEQCTFIAHHKGKCDVKKGSYSFLEPMKQELTRRGLNAIITSKN